MSRRQYALALTVIMAVGVVAQVSLCGQEPLWQDELRALLDSAANLARYDATPYDHVIAPLERNDALSPDVGIRDVWRGMTADTHPPLYFMALHLWRRIAGDNIAVMRLLSVVCAAVAVVVFANLLRRMMGPVPALAGAALACWANGTLLCAMQIRPYALSLALVCLGFWLVASVGRGRARWPLFAWAIVAVATPMTHYLMALPVAAQACYALHRSPPGMRLRWITAAAASVLSTALLWGAAFHEQREVFRDQAWLIEAGPGHVSTTLARGVALPVRLLVGHSDVGWPRGLVLAGLALHIVFGSVVWRQRRNATTQLLGLWYGVVLAALLLVDLTTGRALLAHLRYATAATPAVVGLIVVAVQAMGRPLRFGATLIVIAGMAVSLRIPPVEHPEVPAAAALISDVLTQRSLLLFDGEGWPKFWPRRTWGLVTYYLPDPAPPTCMLSAWPPPVPLAPFDRLIVVSHADRVAETAHRLPGFVHGGRSPYLWQVGWIDVYDRAPSQTPIKQP